jgi:hypothetical protein
MPAMPMPATIDPLSAFIAGASDGRGRPIPLASTRFDVEIEGGLATVVTKRVFRNDETGSIEATITFPVPVHAVLFDLEARIDGRVVKARAQRRSQAREVYEEAIECGKAAVLHEEVLRGVHMLSVAHLGPGKEIEVTTAWAAALSFAGDQWQLRIPLTVGDIYGRSGLPDSDDLLTGAPVQSADLSVHCANGVAAVRGAKLEEGRTRVPLNAPIDLAVTNAAVQELCGVAADGREAVLRISPHQAGCRAMNVAVLVDHSSSMDEVCSGRTGRVAKHEAVIIGLRTVAQRLGENDIVDLWEFDDRLAHVGSSHGASPKEGGHSSDGRPGLLSLIARLTHPRGGTEIGGALAGTIAGSGAPDILLITDGKSHALDVHELARKGRRITVVLVGEDSLEANVGHLAALSGGDIFVAAGDDIADALAAAIGSLRAPCEGPGPVGASLERIRVVRGNAVLEAEWRPATAPSSDAPRRRCAAVMAASLALPVLDEERAAILAEAEGLVTHLTSLVLVDEEGEVQEGIPATRKIALPATYIAACAAPESALRFLQRDGFCEEAPSFAGRAAYRRHDPEAGVRFALPKLTIDWDISPNVLFAGDLSALDQLDASVIEEAAALPDVVAFANEMNIAPVVLVIGLLARHASRSSGNRSAARIAGAILGKPFGREPDKAKRMFEMAEYLGLAC